MCLHGHILNRRPTLYSGSVVSDSMLDCGNEASQRNRLVSVRGNTDLDQVYHPINCSFSCLIKCPNVIMIIIMSNPIAMCYTTGLSGTLWNHNWPTWTACGHFFSKSLNKYEKPGQDVHLNVIDCAGKDMKRTAHFWRSVLRLLTKAEAKSSTVIWRAKKQHSLFFNSLFFRKCHL